MIEARFAPLFTRWFNIVEQFDGVPSAYWAGNRFRQIIAAYSEKHRMYHTTIHLENMFRVMDFFYPDASPLIQLATFYHDFVYDPASATNEADSAVIMNHLLRDCLPGKDIRAIARAIQMTAGHRLEECHPEDYPLLVADLSSLSNTNITMMSYQLDTSFIRSEYDFLSDEEWKQGRLAFIEDFLSRSNIFPAEDRFTEFETQARGNLSNEREDLTRVFGEPK